MTKRKYPDFFTQQRSLSMAVYEHEQEEKKFRKPIKIKKKKKTKFVSCEQCELYAPTPEGKFGCKRKGYCIH